MPGERGKCNVRATRAAKRGPSDAALRDSATRGTIRRLGSNTVECAPSAAEERAGRLGQEVLNVADDRGVGPIDGLELRVEGHVLAVHHQFDVGPSACPHTELCLVVIAA